MAPVFDALVFDPGVFDTGVEGMAATMSGSGTLTGALKPFVILLSSLMAGSGSLSGSLLTEILLAATMDGHGELTGNLKVARFVGRLAACGAPLTTQCQDWILGNRDPRRDG